MTPQDLGRRWLPKNADKLLDAFNAGLLEETHWCDLKADLGSNRESAKDMSAFSIDGGTIVVGIDEKKPDGEPRHPVTLKGLPEKLEQIAQMSIHPPLQISCTTIDSGNDDGKGYVLVHIPASALAPHQVDSTYYARSDKTTIRMSEPEVERLYQRRAQWNRDADDMLAKYMAAGPLIGRMHPPQLFIVARPVGGWPEMCRDLVSGPDWQGKIHQLKFNIRHDESIGRVLTEAGIHPGSGGFLSNIPMYEKTGTGALVSNRMSPGQPVKDNGTDRRLEISEDGEMRLFFNALHFQWGLNDVPRTGLNLASVVALVRELLGVARYLSNRCGHSAMWDFGLGLDGMSGVKPILNIHNPFYADDHPGYPAAEYHQTARASVLDLEKVPGAVAERLAGKLYRTFDVDDERLLAVFDDPAEKADTTD
jgi:hypothetical protein